MEKSTISMAIFNSYVKLPEGIIYIWRFPIHGSYPKSSKSWTTMVQWFTINILTSKVTTGVAPLMEPP